ncbi:MAG: hypothetical protein ACREEN_00995 [Stellaceae bacterium]
MAGAVPITAADLDVVTRTAIGEADGETEAGKVGVIWCIRTRSTWDEILDPGHPEHEWWGTTPGKVCKHPEQFSCWNGGPAGSAGNRVLGRITRIATTDPDYVLMRKLVEQVFAGQIENPTASIGGSTHYKVVGTRASWDKQVEAMGLPGLVIDHHHHFRLGPGGAIKPAPAPTDQVVHVSPSPAGGGMGCSAKPSMFWKRRTPGENAMSDQSAPAPARRSIASLAASNPVAATAVAGMGTTAGAQLVLFAWDGPWHPMPVNIALTIVGLCAPLVHAIYRRLTRSSSALPPAVDPPAGPGPGA